MQWGAGMVICLERGADLHMAQLMPLPLTVSCFSKIQIGFTFLVLAHPGSPGKRAVKRVCVCGRVGSQGERTQPTWSYQHLMLSAAQVQLAEQLSSHPHDYTHRRKHTQSSIESTMAVNRTMGDCVNLRKIIQQPCLQ